MQKKKKKKKKTPVAEKLLCYMVIFPVRGSGEGILYFILICSVGNNIAIFSELRRREIQKRKATLRDSIHSCALAGYCLFFSQTNCFSKE